MRRIVAFASPQPRLLTPDSAAGSSTEHLLVYLPVRSCLGTLRSTKKPAIWLGFVRCVTRYEIIKERSGR
jgi:hypothetical protein